MGAVDVGDVYPTKATIRDASGDPADGGEVTCTVTLPDDTQVSIPVRHVSTGVYEAGVPVTVPGLHLISWAATGVNASAWDDSFTASDPARVYPLSLREVKALLGMETHTYDDVLDQLIADVCEAGEDYTGHVFGRRAFAVTMRGTGSRWLTLTQAPVLSIATLTVDGVLLDPSAYWLDNQAALIDRVTETWPATSTIVVTGTVGYTAQPRSHVIGARTLIRHLWRERRGAVKAGTPLDDMLPFGIPHAVADFWDLTRATGFA